MKWQLTILIVMVILLISQTSAIWVRPITNLTFTYIGGNGTGGNTTIIGGNQTNIFEDIVVNKSINFGNETIGVRNLMWYLSGASGIPLADGFRIDYDFSYEAPNDDWLIFRKTDANDIQPDGGIAFVMTGSDGVNKTSLKLTGDGNANFTYNVTANHFIGNGSQLDSLQCTSIVGGTDANYCVDAEGYNSLADLKTSVSNDFHNLGGVDATGGNSSEQMVAIFSPILADYINQSILSTKLSTYRNKTDNSGLPEYNNGTLSGADNISIWSSINNRIKNTSNTVSCIGTDKYSSVTLTNGVVSGSCTADNTGWTTCAEASGCGFWDACVDAYACGWISSEADPIFLGYAPFIANQSWVMAQRYLLTETDPQVGVTTASRICIGNGTGVNCNATLSQTLDFSGCAENKILKRSGTDWECADDATGVSTATLSSTLSTYLNSSLASTWLVAYINSSQVSQYMNKSNVSEMLSTYRNKTDNTNLPVYNNVSTGDIHTLLSTYLNLTMFQASNNTQDTRLDALENTNSTLVKNLLDSNSTLTTAIGLRETILNVQTLLSTYANKTWVSDSNTSIWTQINLRLKNGTTENAIVGIYNVSTLIDRQLTAASCDVKSYTNGTIYCGTDATSVGGNTPYGDLTTITNTTTNMLSVNTTTFMNRTEDALQDKAAISGNLSTYTNKTDAPCQFRETKNGNYCAASNGGGYGNEWVFDDFYGASTKFPSMGTAGGVDTLGTYNSGLAWGDSTSTGGDGGTAFTGSTTTTNTFLNVSYLRYFTFRGKLSATTTRRDIIGLVWSATTVDMTTNLGGMFFYYNETESANWKVIAANMSIAQGRHFIDTGVAVDTNTHNFTINSSGTQFQFYIDDTLVTTLNNSDAYFPRKDVAMLGYWNEAKDGTQDYTRGDYMYFRFQRK